MEKTLWKYHAAAVEFIPFFAWTPN